MTKLFCSVEIKCYPSSDFRIADFISFVDEHKEKVAIEIVEQLLHWDIKTIDLVPTIKFSTDTNCILFSFKGRAIAKPSFLGKGFYFTKKTIEKALSDKLLFLRGGGDLSIYIDLKKPNILDYYIFSLKNWFSTKKINIKISLAS